MTNEEYFADLDQKNGIEKQASGLRTEELEAGDGPSPKPSETVRVHYEGKLIDGTVFDSSHKRGQPADFPVGAVIPGFAEGLQLTKEGGKTRLHIPPEIGYGASGTGPIPPNAALIFDVELIKIL
jgi:FKBP-type peptidyl-prolyl cis-trans isomerase FklB